MKKGSIAIVGTGPAALMAGTLLVENGFDVQFFDHKKAPARKFLVAGHGGFNLTNTEELPSFCDKYDS
ncbi:MAG: aminoacetone oxidase family FAD-binding enzyme, partial [Crocinitomicaceae bacterium]